MTTSIQLAEPIMRTAIAYFEANGATKIAEVMAAWNATYPATEDLVTLENFARVTFEDPRYTTPSVYPVLHVFPVDGAIVGLDPARHPSTYAFQFAVLAQGIDEEHSKAAAMRYMIAVVEMLNDMHSHPARPLHWGTGGASRIYYLPTRPLGPGGTAQVADIRLVTSIEHKG